MLDKAFLHLTARSAFTRRLLFRLLFEYLARRSGHLTAWTHMNYGYANGHDHGHTIELRPGDELERFCHQLYHLVAGAVDLTGRDVVEVSCGRGGGSAFMRRYLRPRTVTGIDIAASAIAFCRRVHPRDGLRFVQGDAEDLPIFDDSVDAVVNVEASFCYGDLDRFFAVVRRVLRPGGHFLYADLRLTEEIDALAAAIARSGLTVLERDDITASVVRALELDHERRVAGTRAYAPWYLRPALNTFTGTRGTRIPTLLGSGRMRYLRFVLRKPWPTAPSAGHVLSAANVTGESC